MKNFILLISLVLISNSVLAQFEIEKYKIYLNSHKNMTYEDLLKEYPAGNFLSEAPVNLNSVDFASDIIQKFKLTEYEKQLIEKHGFMVTERLSYYNFMQGFWDVYNNDMPVYISSDAILHALHYSFDEILYRFEKDILKKELIAAIWDMKTNLKKISTDNSSEIFIKAVKDVDIYLTVTEKLLNVYDTCYYPENEVIVNEMLKLIKDQNIADVKLFSETPRLLDFSQFTPRGHYTREEEMKEYFRAMIWLGRTEILLSNPQNEGSAIHSAEDLHRMAILTALIAEISKDSGAESHLLKMESILTFLLGRQDNINIWEVNQVLSDLKFTARDLLEASNQKAFTQKLLEFKSANQLYNSQILFSDPTDPNKIVTPSVFLLMGQRPILDGFITANVVYDRILFEEKKVKRMVPSTMDILFSLGNDASAHLLKDEISKYPYSSNLAALRYLIDAYDNDYWKSSTYTCWLNGIRSLNPPAFRGNMPKFMQTAAWWQKTMNTQLASWAELRHDFLLYAKQPYTSGIGCSYPYGYVEPVPEFYSKIQDFFKSLIDLSNSEALRNENFIFGDFANYWISTCETLKSMANKILLNKDFSQAENDFISNTLLTGDGGCYTNIDGWYQGLYYNFETSVDYMTDTTNRGNAADDFIVADVHTIPTDEDGNMVGWVLHAGTGRINMAVITANTPSGGTRAYMGPVSSYYEFLSNGFKRLTNEEWRQMDGAPAYRPAFTNLYLADKSGNSPNGEFVSLLTVPASIDNDDLKPDNNYLNIRCYPNPFSNYTTIAFTINQANSDKTIELNICDLEGNIIKSIFDQKLSANNYVYVWDGTNNLNIKVNSGTYIYSIKYGEQMQSGKINLIK